MKIFKIIGKAIFKFFKLIIKKIDKFIIVPITKFILFLSERNGKGSRGFERWLTKKNTLIFISLIMALAFFFAVDNKTFTLVESSAEVLYNQDVEAVYNTEAYVVEGLPKDVDVVLIGRRADLFLAKQLSIKNVTVDLSGLKPGTHKVTLKYENDVSTINYKLDPSTANVTIYPKVSESRTVNVDVLNQDTLNTKLSIQSVDVDQKEIIIKGAEHKLKEVSTVKALVDISNIVEPNVGITNLSDVKLVAYDKSGNVVNVEMVPNKVTATISIISPSKEVPIKVIPTGDVEFGKAVSSITSSVTKVTIYGNEEVIDEIQYIPVNIDVTGLNSAKTYNVVLDKPSGIRYISEVTTTVNVTLDNEITKEIEEIPIEVTNLDSNYKVVSLDKNSNSTSVIVKGTESVVNAIDVSTIKATIDLTGFGIGEHEVTVNVIGEEVRASYTPKTTKVKIKIIKK